MKRKHYDEIIAWANGAEIQSKPDFSNTWITTDYPSWYPLGVDYRVNPDPDPDPNFYEGKWHWLCLSGMTKKQAKAVNKMVEMFSEVEGIELYEGSPKCEKTLDDGWRVRAKVRVKRVEDEEQE